MSSQNIVGEVKQPPPQFEFQSTPRGLGTHRCTGDLITMFLQLERPVDRAQILAWCAIDLGISLEELSKEYKEA